MNARKRIFIIDDEVDLCLLMKTYFLRKNYEVDIAHQFDDALPRVKERQPDIIYLNSAVCTNVEEDPAQIKEAAPHAEIIVDGFRLWI